MALAGIVNDDQLDFPNTVRSAVTTLPFHLGGTNVLTVGVAETLVRVSDLRRFENMDAVVRGTFTPTTSSTSILTDSNASFLEDGIEVGDEVENTTDSTSGTITAVTANTVDVDGISWDTDDAYIINKRVSHQFGRPIEIRKFSVTTDADIYIRYDGTPHADNFDVEIERNTGFFSDNVRVVSRVAVVGVSSSATPKVRWIAWGV